MLTPARSVLDSAMASRTTFGGAAAVVAAVGIAHRTGSAGVAAGGLLVATWLLAGPVYAFALGQVLFGALHPDPLGAGIESLRFQTAAAQAGLFGVLVAPGLRTAPVRTVAAFTVSGAGLVGVVTGVRDVTGRLWPAMVALGTAVAICAYALHRYQLVSFDLVEADA